MDKGDMPCALGQVVFVAATKGSLSCVRTAHCAATLSGTMEDVTRAASGCDDDLSGVWLCALPIGTCKPI